MKFKNRAAAPAHLKTMTELRAARLKLAVGQRVMAWYWQGHHYVELYEPAQAIAMRPKREASPAQRAALAAGRALVGTDLCADCGQRFDRSLLDQGGRCSACAYQEEITEQAAYQRAACVEASAMLAHSPLFLDTETTGLDGDAEVVEIAILDTAGEVLYEGLSRPILPMPEDVRAVNGITDEDLADAPGWDFVGQHVYAVLAGRRVIAHNAAFDDRMLRQTFSRHGMAMPAVSWCCSMELLRDVNGGQRISLVNAARLAGVSLDGRRRHRAADDARLCRDIVFALSASTACCPEQADF